MEPLVYLAEDKEPRPMQDVPEWFRQQSGVIPYRQSDKGVEVLLVTTRRRKHWIIPKGVIEPDLTSAASAVEEAWEEAGVRGWLHPLSIGCYEYEKWQGLCQVEVFLMSVEEIEDQWPEGAYRRRQWFPYQQAAMKLREPELKKLVGQLPQLFCKSLTLEK
jgi:8-oxo-dGTP pyrophosphatase MutT (NUDIX family)